MTALIRPHKGPHTQRFGNIQPDGQPHAGDDFGYTDGVKVYPEVYAAAAGEVLYAGDARNLGWPNPYYLNPDFDRTDAQDSSAGNIVVIGHGDGMTTYNHLESIAVARGQRVKQGQRIATTGDTGYSFGKHLHFEWIPYPANFGTSTYGRVRPTFTTITPQSTEESTLSAAEVKEIKAAILASERRIIEYARAVLVTGYEHPKGKRHYGLAPVLEETQRRLALDDADGPNK